MLKIIISEENPEHRAELEQILQKAFADKEEIIFLNEKTDMVLQVKKLDKNEQIFLEHVQYFVSDKRKIKAVFGKEHEAIEFYMKMSELEERLVHAGFLRCHQSYLVNIHQILYWDSNNITLTDNEKIPVSRKYKKEVAQKFEKLTLQL